MAPKKAGAKKEKKPPKDDAANPEALRAAFAQFDLDGDGALSRDELVKVLTRPTKAVGGEPFSDAEAVTEAENVVNKFDANGDAKLQYSEFVEWLLGATKSSELAVPGASKAAGEEHARLTGEKADAIFATYDKGSKGGLKKAELAQIIRDENDRYAFLDDNAFGPFVKQAWENAAPDGEGLVRIEPFRTWVASFVKHVDDTKAKDAAAAAAASASKAAAVASAFSGDGLWKCGMKMVQDAVQAAWERGKTPLLIDATDDQGGFTALETFYSYSGHQLLEVKKMVVEVNMKKEKSTDDALDEARKKLVLSMKQGYNYVIMCSNSAPPFKSQFNSPTQLPYLLLEDNSKVVSAAGQAYKDIEWCNALLTDNDQIFLVHKDFQVVAHTKFSEEDYVQFLGAEMPLDKMQHIKVSMT